MEVWSGEQAPAATGMNREWIYNTLDVTGTLEVAQNLRTHLDADHARTYAWERAMQAPVMHMMARGLRVDAQARKDSVIQLGRDLRKAELRADKLAGPQWTATTTETGWCEADLGKRHKWPKDVPDSERKCEKCGIARLKRSPFNANSTDQVKTYLYKILKLPPQYNKDGGLTSNDEALDKLKTKYPEKAGELIETILEVRDLKKQIGILNSKLSSNNRFRFSINVGAAWTGRFTSNKNPFQEGGNAQNIGERHRRIFIADPGTRMFYADLEQAESNTVAHLAGDPRYIEAHQLGDVHTYVCRMIFPFLPWTGDLKEDKKIAKSNPPWDQAEGHDWRFQSKRVQHGSNYGLTPQGISIIAHIPLKEARSMQKHYFEEFPYIPAWHDDVRRRIKEQIPLMSPLGTKIHLFGRPWDDRTWRQGLAFIPQRTVLDVIGIGMMRAYYEEPRHDLLSQIHDALLGQWPDDPEVWPLLAAHLRECMTVPVPIGERIMRIGVEVMTGYNWGKQSEDNPRGMEVWHG